MAFAVADRVKETSTTTGTGTLNLAGAEPGYQTFVAGVGGGNTTYYAITNRATSEFEVGIGTVTDAATDTLSRTTVISSSNSNALVNFSAGTKDVICTLPSEKSFVIDNSSNTTITSNLAVTGGATFTANVSLGDSDRINLGASNDLQIYHNGTDSYILDTGAGDLYIGGSSNIFFTRGDGTGASAQFITDGASKLRYNNATKFETTNTGVQTTGTVNVNGAYTLPTADGTSGQVLATDGLGGVSFTTISADITGVTAGNGLTGGGTSGDVTLNVGAGTGIDVAADAISVDVSDFMSNGSNNRVLTAAGTDSINAESTMTYVGGVLEISDSPSPRVLITDTTNTVSAKLMADDNYAYVGSHTNHPFRFLANNAAQIELDTSGNLELFNGTLTAPGATFTGNVSLGDNDYINVGTGNDLQIRHDGSNSYIEEVGTGDLAIRASNNLYLQSYTGAENYVQCSTNGAVKLYYDNAEKLATTVSGATVTGTLISDGLQMGDNDYISLGSAGDFQIVHNGSNSTINDLGTGNLVIGSNGTGILFQKGTTETLAKFLTDGACELYYDSSKKFETTTSGIAVTGGATFTANVSLGDNDYLLLGTGNDLQLYHDGTNSYVQDSGTGNLILAGSSNVRVRPTGLGEDMAVFNINGSVDLYYDNSKKFETTTGGIAVTGAITATGDITAFYTSDETLKTNIANIENPMEKVAQLNGVSYNWTDEAQAKYDHLNGDKEVGVIAQQVEKVLPEMVGTRDDGTKAVRYERMCALLIECVKDLQNQVNELKKGN